MSEEIKDEIEEQFYKYFGIEPIEYRKNVPCLNFLSSGICNITDERCNPSKCNEYRPDKTSRLWRDFMEVYPEITAEKLLEMICIYNSTYTNGYTNYSLLNERNVEKLKEQILKNCLIVRDDIKLQIQQLFKVEE